MEKRNLSPCECQPDSMLIVPHCQLEAYSRHPHNLVTEGDLSSDAQALLSGIAS
jgi:hypothetical protein